MRYFRIIVFGSILFTVYSCHFFREKGLFLNREKALESIRTSQESAIKKDSVITISEIKDVTQETVNDSIEKTIIPEIQKAAPPEFCIIVGSFASMKNAEELRDIFQKQGYDSKIMKLMNGKNSILVAISSFDNYDKANEQLPVIKARISKDAWIYYEKKANP